MDGYICGWGCGGMHACLCVSIDPDRKFTAPSDAGDVVTLVIYSEPKFMTGIAFFPSPGSSYPDPLPSFAEPISTFTEPGMYDEHCNTIFDHLSRLCACPDKISDEQIDSQQQELDSNNKQYWMPDKMCKVR